MTKMLLFRSLQAPKGAQGDPLGLLRLLQAHDPGAAGEQQQPTHLLEGRQNEGPRT